MHTVLTILQTSLVALFFFFPETKYHRENALLELAHATDLVESPGDAIALETNKGDEDKNNSTQPPLAHREVLTAGPEAPGDAEDTRTSLVGAGYPSSHQRWSVWFKIDRVALKLLPRDIVAPFHIATFPIVMFAACCTAFPACALLVLNLLESPVFSAPPFNFPPSSVGYTNFALMGGGIFGLFTAGPFSDWVSMLFTRRNRGVREPEMRLVSLAPFAMIGLIGMTVRTVQPSLT